MLRERQQTEASRVPRVTRAPRLPRASGASCLPRSQWGAVGMAPWTARNRRSSRPSATFSSPSSVRAQPRQGWRRCARKRGPGSPHAQAGVSYGAGRAVVPLSSRAEAAAVGRDQQAETSGTVWPFAAAAARASRAIQRSHCTQGHLRLRSQPLQAAPPGSMVKRACVHPSTRGTQQTSGRLLSAVRPRGEGVGEGQNHLRRAPLAQSGLY